MILVFKFVVATFWGASFSISFIFWEFFLVFTFSMNDTCGMLIDKIVFLFLLTFSLSEFLEDKFLVGSFNFEEAIRVLRLLGSFLRTIFEFVVFEEPTFSRL